MSVTVLWDEGVQETITGWKKLRDGTICKLEIPAKSKRYKFGRACRAEFAMVVEGGGISEFGNLVYRVGEMVRGANERGIYFYLEHEDAENHVF